VSEEGGGDEGLGIQDTAALPDAGRQEFQRDDRVDGRLPDDGLRPYSRIDHSLSTSWYR
jgi:hypothetical protein